MPILSDADLRALRAVQADNFPHRCRLQSPVPTELPTGGQTIAWVDFAVDVPCRLSPISGIDIPRGLALTPETNFRCALPYGQPVAEKDRGVVTGETNGVDWEQTIGFTFIETPKAFASETLAYGTDKIEQVGSL